MWLEQEASRPLHEVQAYALMGWRICGVCQAVMQKASSFLNSTELEANRSLDCSHYPSIDALLESSDTCGLCNLFLYSLKHVEQPEQVARLLPKCTLKGRLQEMIVLRIVLELPTTIVVKFSTSLIDVDVGVRTRYKIHVCCGEEEGLLWFGNELSLSPQSGKFIHHLDLRKSQHQAFYLYRLTLYRAAPFFNKL